MSSYICTRWACDLTNWKPSLQQLSYAMMAIQPEERERIMRFHFFDDFLSSLVGRLLIRKYVSATSGLPYEEVHLERDERGKPFWHWNETAEKSTEQLLKTPTELSFNISHQGGMVVLAGITTSDESIKPSVPNFGIGVDVMKIEYTGGKPLKEFFRLMHKKFSATEWRYITKGCEAQQLKSFMRHWCLKESYVKELGVGITVDLQKISFDVDQEIDLRMDTQPMSNTSLTYDDVPMINWHFEEHLLQPEYFAAIAFRNCKPSKIENFQFLSFKDIIKEPRNINGDPVSAKYSHEALTKPRKFILKY